MRVLLRKNYGSVALSSARSYVWTSFLRFVLLADVQYVTGVPCCIAIYSVFCDSTISSIGHRRQDDGHLNRKVLVIGFLTVIVFNFFITFFSKKWLYESCLIQKHDSWASRISSDYSINNPTLQRRYHWNSHLGRYAHVFLCNKDLIVNFPVDLWTYRLTRLEGSTHDRGRSLETTRDMYARS